MNEIPSRYNPKETEDKWYKIWQENNFFVAKPNPAKKPFCIVIPPPNVTGILHMGHALNNTIQDILVRYHRMKGEESLWMPGTDHAGIATQNVVEKAIAKEGLKRQDIGRDKFIERVWLWKEQYGSTIMRQLKKLGASCDWSRTRFTMDEEYSEAVIEAFVRLHASGLIYQGSYIINWCPRCQTALSDEEAPHRDLDGHLYYLRYPLKESAVHSPRSTAKKRSVDHGLLTVDYIVVATTRPETMLGDTAVAVNPKDRRYKKLIGKVLILPLIGREIKIIADSAVEMKFGTGAVKVTPAHDPNDYLMGKKHNLEFVNVMRPDGRMNEMAGDYRDMDRFEAREVIIEDLKVKGLLEKIEPHQLSAGHCYRCHTLIEPYLSKQWFVKMKPLAKPAIEAVKRGKIKFYPKRWTKVYLGWMENIQDWCISRQIWWGHRIPVYYCRNCQAHARVSIVHSPQSTGKEKTVDCRPWAVDQRGIIVSRAKPEKCPHCGLSDIYQDEDVLDTWFSSWLWPFATFYWPFSSHSAQRTAHSGDDLKYFYPTSVLVTAPEIIFFWVARMIMAGLEFMGEIPFKDVYIHGTVRDIEGKKMSKSLGNIIDPLEIIDEYGVDALRFSLISITAQGQDVYLSKERFEQGRNFANKIWNASRLILMNLEGGNARADLCAYFRKEDISPVNGWILSRFYTTLQRLNKLIEDYRFNEAAQALYGFFWHEFCDWYLEMIKPDIKNPQNQLVMYKVLEKFLRTLHPFMPLITEEIWQRLNGSTSIMIAPWPHVQEEIIDRKAEERMEFLCGLITAIRNMRMDLELPVTQAVNVKISLADSAKRALLQGLAGYVKNLARVQDVEFCEHYRRSAQEFAVVFEDAHVSIPLSGIVDMEKLSAKTEQRLAKTTAEIEVKKKMLSRKEFLKNAPAEVIDKEKLRLEELKETLQKLKVVKDGLA